MTSGSKKRVAIIGSGIAGMSAAIRLAANGYEVTVYESSSVPGGKLHEFYSGKYRFDAGPSLFTLPQLVIDLLKMAVLSNKVNMM
jgi:phytoene dehydrogenase-like protein